MANNGTIDYGGTTLVFDKTSFINSVMPELVQALVTNPTLLKQLNAAVSQAQLQYARRTGSVAGRFAGSNQTGSATKINSSSGIAR